MKATFFGASVWLLVAAPPFILRECLLPLVSLGELSLGISEDAASCAGEGVGVTLVLLSGVVELSIGRKLGLSCEESGGGTSSGRGLKDV